MSANLSCYSEKNEQLRLKKIRSIIDDVKGSIGFATTLLAGLAEEQLVKPSVTNDDVDVKDMGLMELAINPNNSNNSSDSNDPSDPSNLASSPAASEAQEQGQVVASSKEASIQISESLASVTKDPSVANITSLPASESSPSASATATKRERSPYILTIGEISYQLCYGENYIGRDQSNQIVIDNFHISRLHALVVVHSNNKLAIFDLGSLNRTFVNGRLIKCAALEVGDKIKLGSYYQLTLNLSVELGQLTDTSINKDEQNDSSLIH